MHKFFARTALLPDGWAENVLMEVDQQGWFTTVSSGQEPGDAVQFDGPVLPGMPNLHSHAFQRAMAGLAECGTRGRDSFWTWRQVMYDFLRKMTPEDMEDVAARLYVEMLKAGYTSVGEFHYIHHQPDGTPYEDRALSSHHIIRAAKKAGIALTHMPVLYAHGGFNAEPPNDGQKRFLNSGDEILDIIASLRREYEDDPQITFGLALHSLRAVTPEMLAETTKAVLNYDPQTPIHIHIAEQTQEVDDCVEWSNKRPVEWLLDNADVGAHWCLVHATHMTESETRDLAHSGAVAGLCPTTEANLGDGLFNLPEYLEYGGRFGIGSDSHISVNPVEELRWLEYGQRLMRQERTIAKTEDEPHVGAFLYKAALQGGAQALGRATGRIEAGCRADFIVLDDQTPVLQQKSGNTLLDSWIFASHEQVVKNVIAGGEWVVKNGKHIKEEEIVKAA